MVTSKTNEWILNPKEFCTRAPVKKEEKMSIFMPTPAGERSGDNRSPVTAMSTISLKKVFPRGFFFKGSLQRRRHQLERSIHLSKSNFHKNYSNPWWRRKSFLQPTFYFVWFPQLFVSSVTTIGPRRRCSFFRFHSSQRHSITTAALNCYNIVNATHYLSHSAHATNTQM